MSSLIGQQLGNYEVVSLLGKGGMATVYRARQTNIKRDVAIKVIKSDLAESSDFTRRFEREAETIASLDHPHIIKLFDYGERGDLVYLVMQLLKGGSLAELIRKGPLPLETASLVLEQVSSALEYAHVRDIIHRDLKPQNVLLDENGNAFLTDFGIARLVTQTTALTQSGVAVGTPAYMAPEQWQSRFYDARADIYALGIVLFEMLTGRLPFDGETPARLMYLHLQESAPAISLLRPDVPSGVEGVVAKALAKRPDERFQSAIELSQAFKAALGGQTPVYAASSQAPGLARPTPPRIERTQLLSRPSRSMLLGVGVIVLVLILIGGAAVVMIGGQATPTATLTPSNVVVLLPTVPIAATLTNPSEAITKTNAPSPTITSAASITPNQEETINAIVNSKLTASRVKSATPSATDTSQPTPTATSKVALLPTLPNTPGQVPTNVLPTVTSSSTSTQSPVSTPTISLTLSDTVKPPTSTYTVTLTPSPTSAGTTIAIAISTSPISAANADQVKELARLQDQNSAVMTSVAFTPDGTLLASGSDDNLVRLWDLRSGKVLAVLQGHTSRVNRLAFTPDGMYLASSSNDKTVIIWEMDTKTLCRTLKDHTDAVTSLAFGPDGILLAAGSADKTILIWDVYTGKIKATLTGHSDTINSVAFSPDGTLLASGGQDKAVKVWDVKAGTLQATLSGPTSAVSDVAFSPDGTFLISGSPGADRNAVWRWQLEGGKAQPLGDSITGLPEFAGGLAFNPDGTLLAYGDTQSNMRLWDMRAGKGLATLPGHTGAVTGLVFNHDGTLIATSSADKTLRLWGLAAAVSGTPSVTPIPCTVSTDNANTVPIRVGPGKGRGLRDYMAPNQPYQVIGQAQASDGSAWWKLKTNDGSEAWVAQADVKVSGNCGQMGVVPTPPVQIAKPTATKASAPTSQPGGGSCRGDGYPCTVGSDCCSGICNNICLPRPTAPSCKSSGQYCNSSSECCSGICMIPPTGQGNCV